jgi:hypothetical protein
MWKVVRSFMVAAVAAAGFVIAYAPLSAQPPPRCDSASGGGFVLTNSDAQANFGAHGGCKDGAFWGHVNFVDSGGYVETTPYHVRSVEITGYVEIEPNVRDICGIALTNADEVQPVYFRVRMVGDGENGRPEAFGIRLSNGYHMTMRPLGDGSPGGGNIRIHRWNPSNMGPDPIPEEEIMCAGVSAPGRGGIID